MRTVAALGRSTVIRAGALGTRPPSSVDIAKRILLAAA
jgi:hypothetical protein